MKLLQDSCEIIESGESPDSCGQEIHSFGNDINQLFQAIDLKTCVKKKYASMKSKSALKRFSDSESMNLKQTLRGLCLSQASELAAMRRPSKPLSLSSQGKKFITSHTMIDSVQVSRDNGESSQSSNSSSIGECSSSTSVSGSFNSNRSGSSSSNQRPHMSKNSRWEAIRRVRSQHGYLNAGNLKVLKKLGCGDIASVYLAELISTKCLFALKVMDNEFLVSKRKIGRAETEREILQMLDHPFLPTLYSHFRTDKLSCLVMEYCPGGDLHELRQKQPARCFSEQATRFYAAEVLLALEYLHMLGVVYRDLKPENVLVREDGHIMLTDFDLSLRCAVNPRLIESSPPPTAPPKKAPNPNPCADSATSCLDPTFPVSCFSTALRQKSELAAAQFNPPAVQVVAEPTCARSNSFVGTHEYLAPEIVKGEGHGNAVDWWTFGIFMYEMLYGRTPFRGSENEETLANVVSRGLRFPERPVVTSDARDLMRRLLAKEPEKRAGCVKGAAEIKQHPFFRGMNWALIRCATPPEIPKVVDDDGDDGDDEDELGSSQKKMMKNKSLKEFIDTGEELGFNVF